MLYPEGECCCSTTFLPLLMAVVKSIFSSSSFHLNLPKNGYEAINNFTQKQNFQSKLTGYCFDDLGTEQQIKHFGNDCNVMAEILISRYEHFVENKSITHITTNLSATEIEKV